MEDTLVSIALFAVIPFIVWAVSAYRHKSHAETINLLDTMVNKGEPVTTELVEILGVRREPKHADIRLGLILIAISIATVLFDGAVDDAEAATLPRARLTLLQSTSETAPELLLAKVLT